MADIAPIRIAYTEDEAYFLEAYDRLPREFRTDHRAKLGTLLLVGVAVGLTTYRTIMDFRAGDRFWWLALAAVPAIFGAIWWWTFSARARRQAFLRGIRQHLETGVRSGTATFDEDGFVSASSDGRSKTHTWDGVPRAIVRPDGLFVFIDATTSFWFPHRAFESEAECRRLEQLLARHVPNLERTTA
jgi:hypothetical protein